GAVPIPQQHLNEPALLYGEIENVVVIEVADRVRGKQSCGPGRGDDLRRLERAIAIAELDCDSVLVSHAQVSDIDPPVTIEVCCGNCRHKACPNRCDHFWLSEAPITIAEQHEDTANTKTPRSLGNDCI